MKFESNVMCAMCSAFIPQVGLAADSEGLNFFHSILSLAKLIAVYVFAIEVTEDRFL